MTTTAAKRLPRDADAYDVLMRERERQEYGAYSRAARTLGVSAQHLRNVERRYQPRDDLAYEPPPDAYDPATPPLQLATPTPESPTESATAVQHVMSSSARVARVEPAMLQLVSVKHPYAVALEQSLQVVRSRPPDDGRYVAAVALVLIPYILSVTLWLALRTGVWWGFWLMAAWCVPWAVVFERQVNAAWSLWRPTALTVAILVLAGAVLYVG